jgi:hypothetical protein
MIFRLQFLEKKLSSKHAIVIAVLLVIVYACFANFITRANFTLGLALIFIAFVCTYILIYKTTLQFWQLATLSVVFRFIFFVTVPFLSQDFFRFIWDGELLLNGINPYLQNVDFYVENNKTEIVKNASILIEGMGSLSTSNFTNYPPLSQFLYGLSAWVSNGSIIGFIVTLRVLLIGFDVLFMVYAKKILEHFQLHSKSLFLYILNPLTILEITGNLHLEGVMISLFIVSFYFLIKKKHILSALLLSLSISAKLLSLLFLPFIIKYILKNNALWNLKKAMFYSLLCIGFTGVQFLYFFDEQFASNFIASVGLWFNTFEFNASFYYVFRWVGYKLVGWNTINTYGTLFPVLFIFFNLILFLFTKINQRKLLHLFLLQLTVYFLFSTTVHPWYVLFPLALSVFTKYRYPMLWSFVIYLSYHAYSSITVKEHPAILLIEYGLLLGFIIFELWKPSKPLFWKRSEHL